MLGSAHAAQFVIDPRPGETSLKGRQSGDGEIEMIPPRKYGHDLASLVPRVGVMPTPEGVGLDPADLPVLTIARDDGDAGPPIRFP